METLDFIEFRLDFKMFGVEFFIFLESAFIVRVDFGIKCRLSFIRSFVLFAEFVIVLIDYLGGDMLRVAFKESISETGLSFAIKVDLTSVGILLIDVKRLLIAIASSFWCQGDVIVALFFSEGGSVVVHFITKYILLISLRANLIPYK